MLSAHLRKEVALPLTPATLQFLHSGDVVIAKTEVGVINRVNGQVRVLLCFREVEFADLFSNSDGYLIVRRLGAPGPRSEFERRFQNFLENFRTWRDNGTVPHSIVESMRTRPYDVGRLTTRNDVFFYSMVSSPFAAMCMYFSMGLFREHVTLRTYDCSDFVQGGALDGMLRSAFRLSGDIYFVPEN